MNVNCNKQDTTRYDCRMNPASSSVSTTSPSIQTYGAIRAPQYYNEYINNERHAPDILNAFRNNPYTHSLTTSV